MDKDFFNQRVQEFGGEFRGIDALFHQGDPFFCVSGALAFSGNSRLKLFNLFFQFRLFALVLPGQHIEVVFRDTPRRPVLIHPGKQGIDLGFPLLRFFQFSGLLFSCGGLSFVIGVQQPLQKLFFIMLYQPRPVLQTGENIGVKHIIADVVHGALACALPVLAAMVVAINRLLTVWESSVRATHLFLSDSEIKKIKEYVPQALIGIAHLMIAEDDRGCPVAFMGIEDGTLEMLFISPEERGKGLGKRLLQYGIKTYAVERVAVNEQNPQAKGFYEHLGFQVYKRTDLDEQGNPYPLLYMSLNI